MSIRDDIRRAAEAHGEQAAMMLVERRAAADDPEALLMLGEWRLWGVFGPRDLVAGYNLVRRAAEIGHLEAASIHASLLATGTGTRRDFPQATRQLEVIAPKLPLAASQIELLGKMDRQVPAPIPVRDDPLVARIEALLTIEECRYLMMVAEPRLRPSFVVDPVTGRRRAHPVRTSDGTNFAPVEEDLVIHAINCRIAAASGTRVEQGEPLNVLRYSPGQQYRPHMDGLPGVHNQRIITAIVYLNPDFEGGETDFPHLGIRLRGAPGDAILFGNVDDSGRPDPLTEHAGLPVTSGTKWIATRWIRERAFHPWRPETA